MYRGFYWDNGKENGNYYKIGRSSLEQGPYHGLGWRLLGIASRLTKAQETPGEVSTRVSHDAECKRDSAITTLWCLQVPQQAIGNHRTISGRNVGSDPLGIFYVLSSHSYEAAPWQNWMSVCTEDLHGLCV